MPRSKRCLPQGHSFHVTLRCNSRQFLIAKGLRRDVLLAVLAKAKQKVDHKVYAVCLMANHLHLLIKPKEASQLPKLMHWIGWYSAMALNRLSGRCGHFWESRYYSTAIAPKDHNRALNTLRYSHANPKAAGVRKGFLIPIPTMATMAGWPVMASVSGIPAFCSWPPVCKSAQRNTEAFARRITPARRRQPTTTGVAQC